jgi:hypothetical protein
MGDPQALGLGVAADLPLQECSTDAGPQTISEDKKIDELVWW